AAASVIPLLLPALGLARKAARLLGGAEQGPGLVDAFLLLEGGIGVGNNAGAGLHIDVAVLEQRRAQYDAAVHRTVGGEVADAPGIEPALLLLQFVDDLHGAHLGGARHGAGREPGDEGAKRVVPVGKPALDIGDDVHHLAVALDEELVGDRHRADLGDAADIVAPEVEQHEVLGPFLGIGEELGLERLVFVRRGTARARAGDRAHGDDAVA